MSSTIRDIFLEELKEDFKFFVKNFKEIIKRTWSDFLNDFKYDWCLFQGLRYILYMVKRLYRSGKNRILGGVCGGIGEYLDTDPTVIRLIWIIFTLISFGLGIIAYILAWIIIPRNPKHKWKWYFNSWVIFL